MKKKIVEKFIKNAKTYETKNILYLPESDIAFREPGCISFELKPANDCLKGKSLTSF